MKNILVTGGAGFIGSNFLCLMTKKYPNYNFINLDSLTYAGNLENLREIENLPNYSFVKCDIRDSEKLEEVFQSKKINSVIHLAAESHVDRSILGPKIFVETNVVGTQNLLDLARKYEIEKFIHISTDEVYGSLSESGKFTETTSLHPNSPYSASKASSDLLALSYEHTFKMPVIVTRCSNNYGPFQFPEKLIPLMIINALNDKSLPVYGDGLNVRDWLFVDDHSMAIDEIFHNGKIGEVYNIGGNNEWRNIEIVKFILNEIGKPESLITFVKDRPGHDKRYAMDATKLKNELGWEPKTTFENGLPKTIKWYLENKNWWENVTSGEYQKYYETQYVKRIKI
ncbi:MAG: dTDP-glucose 4,6-dehydratase [Bacteroidota bacterium]